MIKSEYLYNASIIKIIDGDTVDAMVDLGFSTFAEIRFRLYGVDAKEIHDADATKRELGNRAKDLLIDALLYRSVTLKTYKKDKYGRWLAEIFIDDQNINKKLIQEGLAVDYYGGKR